jgi:7-cyano-7-deazaguanine reductase
MTTKKLTGLDRRYDQDLEKSIDTGVLETLRYEYPGKNVEVFIETDEFTAVCPYSGLPDFATISVRYVPDKVIVELRSLKYYLFSFRNVGMYQEHVTHRILDDLVRACRPKWMEVVADYKVRGGLHTITRAERGKRPA